MRLNKNVLIVFLLFSVFAVGTLNFVDTVEATSWKKFDSGTFNDKGWVGLKDKKSYVSYIKGSKNIKINVYGYRTKNNKKEHLMILYISRTGNKIKTYAVAYGEKTKPEYLTTKMSVKQLYKSVIYEMKYG